MGVGVGVDYFSWLTFISQLSPVEEADINSSEENDIIFQIKKVAMGLKYIIIIIFRVLKFDILIFIPLFYYK